jgi:hypothetical protein
MNIPENIMIAMPIKAYTSGCSLKNIKPINRANRIALYLNGAIKDISPIRITKTAV